MANFGDLVQKAFYLGVGAASYAIERAGGSMGELRVQVQKLVDEMVARGEITAEEAKGMVEDMLNRAQQQAPSTTATTPGESAAAEPRRIEILEDDDSTPTAATSATNPPIPTTPQSPPQPSVTELRQQLEQLQAELKRLKRN